MINSNGVSDLESVKAHLQFAEFLLENDHFAGIVQFDDDGNPLVPRFVACAFRE